MVECSFTNQVGVSLNPVAVTRGFLKSSEGQKRNIDLKWVKTSTNSKVKTKFYINYILFLINIISSLAQVYIQLIQSEIEANNTLFLYKHKACKLIDAEMHFKDQYI